MAWFAAHAVCTVKFSSEEYALPIPTWENILMIEAESAEIAITKAESIARSKYETGPGDEFTYNGRSAIMEFTGIRKLVSGELCPPGTDCHPDDGSEVTYAQYELDDLEDLRKLMAGLPVRLLFEGHCLEENQESG